MKDWLFIPHVYEKSPGNALSWWDDAGFILGDRRAMVRWRHPRKAYEDETRDRAWGQAGEPPQKPVGIVSVGHGLRVSISSCR